LFVYASLEIAERNPDLECGEGELTHMLMAGFATRYQQGDHGTAGMAFDVFQAPLVMQPLGNHH
jgi:hypothetical protein